MGPQESQILWTLENHGKTKVLELSTPKIMKELVACRLDLSSNMTPENQWLKHDNCLLGWPIFGNYASFRECTVGSLPNIKYSKSPSVHAKNWWDHAKLPDRSIFQCPRK